ncbi:MAG: oligosaccharide flippase family protein [Gammaproteobacteria bacterium]
MMPNWLQIWRKEGTFDRLLRGIAGSSILRISAIFLTLGTGVLLARVLGATGYGVYSYAYAIVTVLVIPAQLGLPTLAVREFAILNSRGDWALMRGLLRRSNQIAAGWSVLLITVSVFVAWLYWGSAHPVRLEAFLWALALIPLLALGTLRGGMLRGLHRVVIGQLPEQILRPGLLVVGLLILAVLSGRKGVSPQQAMAAHVLAAAIAYLVGAWMLFRCLPRGVRAVKPRYQTKAWLVSVLPLSFLLGMQIIISQTDILVIGAFLPTREIGIYRAAVQTSMLLLFPTSVASMVFAPYFASLYASERRHQLQKLVTWSSRGALAVALIPGIILIVFNHRVLQLVFGPEFSAASWVLVLLCIGQLVGAALGPVGMLMNMTGNERKGVPAVVAALLVNVALCLVLVPMLGIEGAAISTVVSYGGYNMFFVWLVHRHTGIVSLPVRFPRLFNGKAT